jgi:hypothetical protein
MANGHGGYRKPTNPAPVSGPGAHSRRTDGQPTMALPNAKYGEGKDFQSIEQGAKMASSPAAAAPSASTGSQSTAPSFTGMGAPTQQPNVPVTAGASQGAGPGPEAIGIRGANTQDADALKRYLPTLIDIAQRDDTLPGTKQWIRTIIASLS